jgi:hypothetical protein
LNKLPGIVIDILRVGFAALLMLLPPDTSKIMPNTLDCNMEIGRCYVQNDKAK